jgi:hypothetical protein
VNEPTSISWTSRRSSSDSTTKRAKAFNPSSLKEYGRRVHRAVDLYLQWHLDPGKLSPKTRATIAARRRERGADPGDHARAVAEPKPSALPNAQQGRGFQSAFPIRPGTVVTLSNVPSDLTAAEADRLAQFVKMLVVS